MTMNRNVDKIHTTIGERVVALSDAAFELCAKKRDAYFLVALAIKHLLRRTQRDEAADIANPASSCIYSLARGRPLSRSSSNPSLAQAYRPTRQKEFPHYWNATKRSPQRNCGVSRCMTCSAGYRVKSASMETFPRHHGSDTKARGFKLVMN